MRNADKNAVTLWIKRLFIYICGLFCIATGIAFSAKSGLGVSPIGSPANVLYQIGLSLNLSESFFNLGNWTIAVYCVYILSQILILGKHFKPLQLLQLAVSFAFGWLVNLTTAMASGLPLAKVQEMEEHLMREAFYDFKAGAYEMTGEGMSIEERLFVAQTTAIRKIAAGDESCVIMGCIRMWCDVRGTHPLSTI